MVKKVLRNPGRALELGANVGNAFAYQSRKAALSSLPEVINSNHTGKRFNLGEFECFMLYNWHQRHQNYMPLLHY